MRSRLLRTLLMAFFVCAAADVVYAGVVTGAFAFSNSLLNRVFLWPFALGGCG